MLNFITVYILYYYVIFNMREIKQILFLMYVLNGLAADNCHGFKLSETRSVYENPIISDWNQPIFSSNPRFGFNRDYLIQPSQSDSRIWNENTARNFPIDYHVIIYENNNAQTDNLLPILNFFLNSEIPNEFETKPVIDDVYVFNDNQNLPVTKQSKFNSVNGNTKHTLVENDSRIQQQHIAQENQVENNNPTTTEPVAILGHQVVVPANEISSEAINTAIRAKISARKQCVQDCQSSSSYDPVCGTDNVTYFNNEKFLCARQCGIDISIANLGICS